MWAAREGLLLEEETGLRKSPLVYDVSFLFLPILTSKVVGGIQGSDLRTQYTASLFLLSPPPYLNVWEAEEVWSRVKVTQLFPSCPGPQNYWTALYPRP